MNNEQLKRRDELAVSGPCSTLPGATSDAEGMMCDDHPEVPAYRRVQGETDSFGAEYHFMCKACYDENQQYVQKEREESRYCDWCKTTATGVSGYRDIDEGMSGPVYQVCPACRKEARERINEEIEASLNDYDDWDD